MNYEQIIKDAYSSMDLPETDLRAAVRSQLSEPARKISRPYLRRIALIAAIIIITAGTALAVTSQWFVRTPEWKESNPYFDVITRITHEGIDAYVEGFSYPFSVDFRAYINAGDWLREDSWDGTDSYYTFAEDLEVPSVTEVSKFFNVKLADNIIISAGTDSVYNTLVAYDPIFDSARINVFSNYTLEDGTIVSGFYTFDCNDDSDKQVKFTMGFYEYEGTYSDDTAGYYLSPVNGIEALILNISPLNATAVFSLDNVVYQLNINYERIDNNHFDPEAGESGHAAEILKKIIDAYY